jgi:outer membrane protein TolC
MIALTILWLCAAQDVTPPLFFAGNEELRAWLVEAAERNPGLKARYFEWQAALEKAPQVTAFDDPMFTYSQFVRSQDKVFLVVLEQKFPWFGTLRARGDKAIAEADASLARFYGARNELFANLKRAYFEYGLLGENLNITESQGKLLKEVEEIVRSRYALGMSAEPDVYRVQIEQEKIQDRHAGLSQSKPALAARLNEFIGREAADEPAWPQAAELPPAPPPAPVILAQIRVVNPDLAAAQHLVERWEKEIVLARKSGYPEFVLGVVYGGMKDRDLNSTRMRYAQVADEVKMFAQDAPANGVAPTLGNVAYDLAKSRYLRESDDVKDDVMISLGLSLPIWRGRVNAGVREAKLMEEAAQLDKGRLALALDSAAHTALFNIEDGHRRIVLYQDVLVPKAKQTYASLVNSYAAGAETDILDLLNSATMILEFQLEHARAVRDVQVAAAELEMLMGGPWTSVQVKEAAPVTPASP